MTLCSQSRYATKLRYAPDQSTRNQLYVLNAPKGVRTPVSSVKGRCPRPLDDGSSLFELIQYISYAEGYFLSKILTNDTNDYVKH